MELLTSAVVTSLLFNGRDFDRGDEGLETVKVFIAFWQNAECGEFAFAKLRGQVFESPTQNHHVGRGKGEHEFLRRCISVVTGIRVWSDGVVNQLVGVKAVAIFLVQLEFDAGAILVCCGIALFIRDFLRA